MKEWPKALQERFPSNAHWPERPWWRRDAPVGSRAYMQRGGAHPDGGSFGVFASEPEAAAGVDQRYPLHFPGIRVGQVWALVYPTGEPAIFQITEYDADHEDDVGSVFQGYAYPVDSGSVSGVASTRGRSPAWRADGWKSYWTGSGSSPRCLR